MKRIPDVVSFVCAYCGAENEVEFDPAEGLKVDLHEDCWVCCRPNLVHVSIDEDTLVPVGEAEMDI